MNENTVNEMITKEKRKLLIYFLIIGISLLLCFVNIIGIKKYKGNEEVLDSEMNIQILTNNYKAQNEAFCIYGNGFLQSQYLPATEIAEGELYLKLYCYNDWVEEPEERVTRDEIEAYLSNEYNEDGSLRISNCPDNIANFISNFPSEYEINYYNDFHSIIFHFESDNPELEIPYLHEMSIEQVQEFINKYEDETYEINTELF